MKTNTKTTIVSCLAIALIGFGGSGCKRSDQPLSDDPFQTIKLQDGLSIELVKSPQGFWIGKTEVTQAQWEALMGENPSEFKGPDNPVENVSWDDCQTFLRKLNDHPAVKESGLAFRLPTEEEWELACLAGGMPPYGRLAKGTDISADSLGQTSWFKGNSQGKTHPVGQKSPNAFGVYDILGNVWEWTSSSNGDFRIYRGGSWDLGAEDCKATSRYEYLPIIRGNFLGLRLCAE